MEPINDLEDLFVNYIQTLYAAEKQIMEAMPAIMKKARHQSLKNALQHHLTISKKHSTRLHKIINEINEVNSNEAGENEQEITLQEDAASSGITGLITEVQELLNQKIDKYVNDAAIIGCVQKIEHYEICTYGTALAYATQLNLPKASELLRETLDEEYDADDLLTALAMAALNKEGIPEGWEEDEQIKQPAAKGTGTPDDVHGSAITERNIHWPGGRSGTSHRRYPNGESRGH
jgi:ferritin-like metal-binding protein YciE